MLHALTIGSSAFLLFSVQPMISKIVLPVFGGGSSVWLTSLIFFQVLLLAGYSAVHLVVRYWNPVSQAVSVAVVICISFLFVPPNIRLYQASLPPAIHIFFLLLATVGLPYFVLSTTTPLVQHWIGYGNEGGIKNPYILFAVSNAGSLIGLLMYPTIIEPYLPSSRQVVFWSYGFAIYSVLLASSMVAFLRKGAATPPDSRHQQQQSLAASVRPATISGSLRGRWLGRSMIPAAALIVITHHLTVDIVNFPLLWVIPLSLYLISFVLCFLFPTLSTPSPIRDLLCLAPVAAVIITVHGEYPLPFYWKIVLSSTALFAICMFFHGNLEREKPDPTRLTMFYLHVALGGCLGSILAVIIAPLVFNSAFEFNVVLIISAYLMVRHIFDSSKSRLRIVINIIAVSILLAGYANEEIGWRSDVTFRARSFYGTYTIHDLPDVSGKHIAARLLRQGTTTHGGQANDAQNRLVPISYFHKKTGVGSALSHLARLKSIAVVGLGTGVVALYGRPGQRFDFFEIDRTVVNIAQSRFENLKSSRADIRHIVGDARIELRKVPARSYDLLILDAFNSGSIPTHLITTEAMEELFRVLKPDGLILYHISNRYMDLLPVLNCIAEKMGLFIRHHYSIGDWSSHCYAARWVLLTKNRDTLEELTTADLAWKKSSGRRICWSDDFSHLWSVVRLQ